MSPSSTVHGGQHHTTFVTFELLLHAAFVADEIWGVNLCLNQVVYSSDQMVEYLLVVYLIGRTSTVKP